MVWVKTFRGVRDYFALEWSGQQNRGQCLRGVDRVEMTFSVGVQEKRAKLSTGKPVEGEKNMVMVCNTV